MNMKYQCEGRVRTRYWGDFSIMVLLTFNNHEEARKALPAMQLVEPSETFMDAGGSLCEPTGWQIGEEYNDMLIVEASGKDVDRIVDLLDKYGAERKRILSHRNGLDWGEQFTCQVPHVYVDHPNQTLLWN